MLRRATLAILLALLAQILIPATARAAADVDSQYLGESAFLTVGPGQTYTFQVFFLNTGTQNWKKGTPTQVSLAVCLPDKITCNVPSPNRAWNDGSWISDAMYTTQAQPEVVPAPPLDRPGGFVLAPNQIGTFIYFIRVPRDVAAGVYTFNGDLVRHSTLAKVHPEGYYQDATCSCP